MNLCYSDGALFPVLVGIAVSYTHDFQQSLTAQLYNWRQTVLKKLPLLNVA